MGLRFELFFNCTKLSTCQLDLQLLWVVDIIFLVAHSTVINSSVRFKTTILS